jgi:hypothetical protein
MMPLVHDIIEYHHKITAFSPGLYFESASFAQQVSQFFEIGSSSGPSGFHLVIAKLFSSFLPPNLLLFSLFHRCSDVLVQFIKKPSNFSSDATSTASSVALLESRPWICFIYLFSFLS